MKTLKTPIFAVVLNTKCNLKCIKCACQIHKHPQRDYESDYVIAQLNIAFQIYDYADELRISGGEPLMHKEFCEILTYICENFRNQYGRITIPTNGSYMPNEKAINTIEKYRECICVRVDEYGDLSIKAGEVADKLRNKSITVDFRHYHGDKKNFFDWFDFNDEFSNLGYTNDELDKLYAVCQDMIFCPVLWDGKLWVCCTEASGVILGKIPYTPESGAYISAVDVLSDEPILKKREQTALFGTRFLEGCKYCYGLGEKNNRRVPAAIQLY